MLRNQIIKDYLRLHYDSSTVGCNFIEAFIDSYEANSGILLEFFDKSMLWHGLVANTDDYKFLQIRELEYYYDKILYRANRLLLGGADEKKVYGALIRVFNRHYRGGIRACPGLIKLPSFIYLDYLKTLMGIGDFEKVNKVIPFLYDEGVFSEPNPELKVVFDGVLQCLFYLEDNALLNEMLDHYMVSYTDEYVREYGKLNFVPISFSTKDEFFEKMKKEKERICRKKDAKLINNLNVRWGGLDQNLQASLKSDEKKEREEKEFLSGFTQAKQQGAFIMLGEELNFKQLVEAPLSAPFPSTNIVSGNRFFYENPLETVITYMKTFHSKDYSPKVFHSMFARVRLESLENEFLTNNLPVSSMFSEFKVFHQRFAGVAIITELRKLESIVGIDYDVLTERIKVLRQIIKQYEPPLGTDQNSYEHTLVFRNRLGRLQSLSLRVEELIPTLISLKHIDTPYLQEVSNGMHHVTGEEKNRFRNYSSMLPYLNPVLDEYKKEKNINFQTYFKGRTIAKGADRSFIIESSLDFFQFYLEYAQANVEKGCLIFFPREEVTYFLKACRKHNNRDAFKKGQNIFKELLSDYYVFSEEKLMTELSILSH